MTDAPQPPSESIDVAKPIAEDLTSIFEPVLYGLEEAVQKTAASQVNLRSELDSLMADLYRIKNRLEDDTVCAVLEEKAKKINWAQTTPNTGPHNSPELKRKVPKIDQFPTAQMT